MKKLMLMMMALPASASSLNAETQYAYFGGGCFWCLEAVFERVPGVTDVVSGYADGQVPNPTYEQVCTGSTGHAEVVKIAFDPAKVTYEALLDVFWKCHDATTLNRQGADEGTQYRSVILFADEKQKKAAEASKTAAKALFPNPIVTEINPLTKFWQAEDYHQDYFRKHPNAPYCAYVIAPKLKKLKF